MKKLIVIALALSISFLGANIVFAAEDSEQVDVNLGVDSTIAITCDDTVNMGTITGTGQSALTTNEADCNIITNNSAGYQLAWAASTAYMENENGDQIGAYTPGTPNTPEVWSLTSASDSEWGARVKSTSTDPDLTAGAIWGADPDDYTGNWLNVATTNFVIANRASETDQTGSNETIIFGAEVGSTSWQETGTYDVNVTFTATTLS